jgi:4-hydroxy-tetrahydrodipicolinate reductase
MRIGLYGFGKTGKAVAKAVMEDPTMTLEWVVRKTDNLKYHSAAELFEMEPKDEGLIFPLSHVQIASHLDTHPVDAIIDFSSQDGIDHYGVAAAEREIRIVSAISTYTLERQRFLRDLSTRTAVLWSPNITLGVNLLVIASSILRQAVPDADVEIVEEHFRKKSGVSGTAKIIAETLGVNELDVKSIRAGGIIGIHEVVFGLPSQVVRLRHETISREAFGEGALYAAAKLERKCPGFYTMEDLLRPLFGDGCRNCQPLNTKILEEPAAI